MKKANTRPKCCPPPVRVLVASLALVTFGCQWALAAEAPPAIDPHADRLLRRTSDFLSQSPFFSVNAEVWQDVVSDSGQKIQSGRTVALEVRRPDKLHAEVRSTRRNRGIWYDGKSVAILNRNKDLYGLMTAPNNLDETLDFMATRFGTPMPLEDLIVSNPYASVIQKISSATDLGPTMVLGVPCEHLAFSQTNIDWQVWIEDGPVPVPTKLVITYKDEDGSPQYTALLSNWDFVTKLPNFVFEFEPPPGSARIQINKAEQPPVEMEN